MLYAYMLESGHATGILRFTRSAHRGAVAVSAATREVKAGDEAPVLEAFPMGSWQWQQWQLAPSKDQPLP